MTSTEIRNELLQDPAAIGYAPHISAGSNGNLVSLLNAKSYPAKRRVPIAEISSLAFRRNLMTRIEDAAGYYGNPTATGIVNAVARNTIRLLEPNSRLTSVDTSDAAFVGVMDVLEQSNLLTTYNQDGTVAVDGATNRLDFDALADTTFSRAEVLWGEGTFITIDQIREALS